MTSFKEDTHMETGYAVLTVLFEDPFWVGIYERREGRTYQVC